MSSTPPPISNDNENHAEATKTIDLSSTIHDINLNGDSSPLQEEQPPSNNTKQVLSDDLFFSAYAEPSSIKPEEDDMDEIFKLNTPSSASSATPIATKEIRLDEDDEEPFASSSSNQPVNNSVTSTSAITPASINVQPMTDTSNNNNSDSQAAKFTSLSSQKTVSNYALYGVDEEDDEEADKFLEITLSDPSKVGDGMGSYMVYKISIKVIFEFFLSILTK
jgi:hypothetical protein